MLEVLLTGLGYIALQLVAEAIGYGIFHQLRPNPTRPPGRPTAPVSNTVAALAWGCILGGVSVLILKEPPDSSPWSLLPLILAPIGLGGLAQFAGDELERRDRPRNGLLAFWPTAALTFGFAAARYIAQVLVARYGGA